MALKYTTVPCIYQLIQLQRPATFESDLLQRHQTSNHQTLKSKM